MEIGTMKSSLALAHINKVLEKKLLISFEEHHGPLKCRSLVGLHIKLNMFTWNLNSISFFTIWLVQSPSHFGCGFHRIIHLGSNRIFFLGKERLFLEVARVLRKKLYVTAAKLRILRLLGLSEEEDMQWFTVNELESHIHVVPMWTLASFKRLKHISDQYAVKE